MARTPIHPGEHLAEELKELGISAAELSRQIDVPVNRVTAIINGQRGVTADTALRLGHWFGTSPEFWLNLQKLYELRLARQEVGDRVKKLPTLARHRTHANQIKTGRSRPVRHRSKSEGGRRHPPSRRSKRRIAIRPENLFRNVNMVASNAVLMALMHRRKSAFDMPRV